jgi:hypothetical protein
MSNSDEWRRNGLRLQLVSRFVLPRLGCSVLKSQEDSWATIQREPKLVRRFALLTQYMREYADYVVTRGGRVMVVDVKAPVYLTVKSGARNISNQSPIRFSRREWYEYTSSAVPVRILLWLYDGLRPLQQQRKAVRYCLLDLRSLVREEELAQCVSARPSSEIARPRKLLPRTLRSFLRRCRASEVDGIEPGRIIYSSSPRATST